MPVRPVTRDDVLAAAEVVRGAVRRTPLLDGTAFGAGVRLKAELLQHTGSFKARGVTNRLAVLDADERTRGVVGVSAGNHAAALAWGAERAGVDCVVVTWSSASTAKLALARRYGAHVDLEATDPAGAFARMAEIVEATGRVVIHPFDDPGVIAGQGTVGLEVVEDAPDVDAVVVPTGGGGLVSGIAAGVGALGVRVIAVEPEDSAALALALEAGEPVSLAPQTIADGLAAPFAGTVALATCRTNAVESVLVTEDEICEAMRRCYADAKLACEPAAAAGLAALLGGRIDAERPVLVVSGGNVDPRIASAILAGS